MRAAVRSLVAPALLLLGAALAPPAHATDRVGADEERGPLRVLFIGNSFTRFHALHRMVSRLAEGVPGGPAVQTRSETRPGCTLRRHWHGRRARARIRAGEHTHVVLQEHSLRPLDRPDEIDDYARRFRSEIERAGARTVLYETWARRENSRFYRRRPAVAGAPGMQREIGRVYRTLAQDLEADLAPVGRAWLLAGRELPGVSLHGRDGIHPTLAGSYLSASVLYGTLTGRSPADSGWRPHALDAETARALREIAARSIAPD